jgi:hypothetical protein
MLDIQDKKNKIRSESAEKAAKKRWEKNNINQTVKCDTHAERNANAMRGNATDTDTDTNKRIDRDSKIDSRKSKKIKKPDSVSDQVWIDFIAHRKIKKSNLTQTALNGIINQSRIAGWTLEDALCEIITRGWIGFKAEWVNNQQQKGNYQNGKSESKHEAAKRELAEFMESRGGKETQPSPDFLLD